MKNISLKSFTAYILFIICLMFSAKLTFAQQTSISLSPSLNQLAIKPGQSANLNYKLTNSGDPNIVKLKVEPFENKDSQAIEFDILDNELDLNGSLFLKNLESKEVLLNLRVPVDTQEKDYYFKVTAEAQPQPSEEGSINIRAKTSLQSLLLITVTESGQIEIKPKISLFEVVPGRKIELFGQRLNFFNSFEKIPITMTIQNNGRNMFRSSGEIMVKGLFFNSNKYIIEPQTILAHSQKQIKQELPGLLWGSYTLTSTITFGEGTPKIHSSTSLIVFPTNIFIILITLLIICLLLYHLKKNTY